MTDAPAPMDVPAAACERKPWAFAALVARTLVGGLFAATGVAKLVNLPKFAEEIQNYQLFPPEWTNALAIGLAPLEIVAGVFLILSFWRCDARILLVLMLLPFTALKIYAYAAGLPDDCGCGGDVKILKLLLENPQGIVTNLVMLGLLAFDGWQQYCRPRAVRQSDA